MQRRLRNPRQSVESKSPSGVQGLQTGKTAEGLTKIHYTGEKVDLLRFDKLKREYAAYFGTWRTHVEDIIEQECEHSFPRPIITPMEEDLPPQDGQDDGGVVAGGEPGAQGEVPLQEGGEDADGDDDGEGDDVTIQDQVSQVTGDGTAATAVTPQMRIAIFKAETTATITQWVKKKGEYEDAKVTMFNILWASCDLSMQYKLEEFDAYERAKRSKDPLQLWLMIKEASTGISPDANKSHLRMKAQQKFHSLESAGVEPMSEEDQAMSFILKLNANYTHLRSQLLEEKLIKCPKTLAKALKLARERESQPYWERKASRACRTTT